MGVRGARRVWSARGWTVCDGHHVYPGGAVSEPGVPLYCGEFCSSILFLSLSFFFFSFFVLFGYAIIRVLLSLAAANERYTPTCNFTCEVCLKEVYIQTKKVTLRESRQANTSSVAT